MIPFCRLMFSFKFLQHHALVHYGALPKNRCIISSSYGITLPNKLLLCECIKCLLEIWQASNSVTLSACTHICIAANTLAKEVHLLFPVLSNHFPWNRFKPNPAVVVCGCDELQPEKTRFCSAAWKCFSVWQGNLRKRAPWNRGIQWGNGVTTHCLTDATLSDL